MSCRAPSPVQDRCAVRVRATSLNFRDLLIAKGVYNPKLKLPIIPMSDAAGEVAALGEGATRFRVGDRVVSAFAPGWLEGPPTESKVRTALGGDVDGVLAEEVVLPETGLLPIPSHLSFQEAATLPCAAVTAWNALMEAGGIRPGDSVLTQGTGGVSLFAVQFARLAGDSGDRHFEQRREAGQGLQAGCLRRHQLQDDPRLGQARSRTDRRAGGRPDRRGRRRGHVAAVHPGHQGRRANRPHRHPDWSRRVQPDPGVDEKHPAPGDLRRFGPDVRVDAQGRRARASCGRSSTSSSRSTRPSRPSSTSKAAPISARWSLPREPAGCVVRLYSCRSRCDQRGARCLGRLSGSGHE